MHSVEAIEAVIHSIVLPDEYGRGWKREDKFFEAAARGDVEKSEPFPYSLLALSFQEVVGRGLPDLFVDRMGMGTQEFVVMSKQSELDELPHPVLIAGYGHDSDKASIDNAQTTILIRWKPSGNVDSVGIAGVINDSANNPRLVQLLYEMRGVFDLKKAGVSTRPGEIVSLQSLDRPDSGLFRSFTPGELEPVHYISKASGTLALVTGAMQQLVAAEQESTPKIKLFERRFLHFGNQQATFREVRNWDNPLHMALPGSLVILS